MRHYDDLADWWVLMSPPGEYEAEAGPVARLLDPPRSERDASGIAQDPPNDRS